MATDKNSRRIITGKVRLHFPSIFSVDKHGFYSTAILIPKSDRETLKKIKDLTDATKVDPKTVATIGGKFLDSYKTPLRDGDTDRDVEKYPFYKGHYFLNAKSKFQPNVVDRNVEPILDLSLIHI